MKPSKFHGPPDGSFIMAVAERFGQLPDTVESEMSEYWLNRVAVVMEAEAIEQRRHRARTR